MMAMFGTRELSQVMQKRYWRRYIYLWLLATRFPGTGYRDVQA